MADVYGSNYTKEKIDASGKAEIGEVVAKIRCSVDSWSGHAQGNDQTVILLAKIPKGAKIKGMMLDGEFFKDETAFQALAGVGAAAGIKLVSASGAEQALAVGTKVAEESDILLKEDATGAEIPAAGEIFIEFLLD